MTETDTRYILTFSCKDTCGIVAAVSGFLAEHRGFIYESAQFGDVATEMFFLRMDFALNATQSPDIETLSTRFGEQVADPFGMQWEIRRKSAKNRVLIMVSKHSHCLNDLLHRYETKQLPIDIPAVISNHPDLKDAVEWHGIPFYHLPVNGDKTQQEQQALDLIEEHAIDTVVLARYMQILSPAMCEQLSGRAINIHHSFLPSFKGARPYHQAYAKGVKLIGATAHYVTTDLDEGPIIEQQVARVNHTHDAAALTAIGRDIESAVLARALKYHIERRVLLNGNKTVVFG